MWTLAGAHWLPGITVRGPSAAFPASCAPRAVFRPAGVPGEAEQVARCAWSRVGTSVFTAKASTSRGGLRPVLQWAAPPALCVHPWEKGSCFRDAVARPSHRGNALCLYCMEIELLLIVTHERFKNTSAHHTHFLTLVSTTFFASDQKRCLTQLQCPASRSQGSNLMSPSAGF